MKRFLCFITGIGLAACNSPAKKSTAITVAVQQPKHTISKQVVAQPFQDTLVVRGRQMVFFMPTEKEYNAMLKKEGGEDLNEVIGDYTEYMGRMIDTLSKTKQLKTTTTDKHVITVVMADGHKVSFNRTKGDNIVGDILCDDVKEPQINWGVATDLDYWDMIKEYYGKIIVQ